MSTLWSGFHVWLRIVTLLVISGQIKLRKHSSSKLFNHRVINPLVASSICLQEWGELGFQKGLEEGVMMHSNNTQQYDSHNTQWWGCQDVLLNHSDSCQHPQATPKGSESILSVQIMVLIWNTKRFLRSRYFSDSGTGHNGSTNKIKHRDTTKNFLMAIALISSEWWKKVASWYHHLRPA